jgi:hypothetical protein
MQGAELQVKDPQMPVFDLELGTLNCEAERGTTWSEASIGALVTRVKVNVPEDAPDPRSGATGPSFPLPASSPFVIV